MNNGKVEIMYFYSDLYEDKKNLSKISKKIRREIKDVHIRLINVENPKNREVAELYGVNMVPIMIFLTPKGEVAARRSMPLSTEDVVQEVTGRINKGELPDQAAEDIRTKILDALDSVTKRSDLTQLVIEQIENDLLEADTKSEIYKLVDSHISFINHAVNDLQEFKKVLQKFAKKQHNFIV
ncbi:MAG: hypothetical protein QXH91_06045 [Candidatus Bathyarchaeia archaeon]